MRLSGDLVPHNWRSAFFFLSLGRCLSVKENAEITPPIIYPQRTQDFPGGSDGKIDCNTVPCLTVQSRRFPITQLKCHLRQAASPN